MCAVKLVLVFLLCLSIVSCGQEKRSTAAQETCGMIEGIVIIDPSPYTLTAVYGSGLEGSPYVRIQLIGQSNTVDYLVGTDFGSIGRGVYRASFRMGAYDCNKAAPPSLQGVKPGEYGILFAEGYFDAALGRVPLKEIVLTTIDNSPIEVESAKTTHIGYIVLTPPQGTVQGQRKGR